MNMRILFMTVLTCGVFSPALRASTITLDFDTAGNYNDNFTEVYTPGNVAWTDSVTIDGHSEYVEKTGTPASSILYNPSSPTADTFGDFSLSFDFSTSDLAGGNNISVYSKVNNDGDSGYLAFLRILNATTADFRLYENGDPSTGDSGTQIGGPLQFTSTGSFVADTFYTFQLSVADISGDVQFTASLFDGITQIGTDQVLTDTTAAVTGEGQIGLRLSSGASDITRLDNFVLTFDSVTVPEPSSLALLASGLITALVMRRTVRQRD